MGLGEIRPPVPGIVRRRLQSARPLVAIRRPLRGGLPGLRADAGGALPDTGVEQLGQRRIGRRRIRPVGLGARRLGRVLLGMLGRVALGRPRLIGGFRHRPNMGPARQGGKRRLSPRVSTLFPGAAQHLLVLHCRPGIVPNSSGWNDPGSAVHRSARATRCTASGKSMNAAACPRSGHGRSTFPGRSAAPLGAALQTRDRPKREVWSKSRPEGRDKGGAGFRRVERSRICGAPLRKGYALHRVREKRWGRAAVIKRQRIAAIGPR